MGVDCAAEDQVVAESASSAPARFAHAPGGGLDRVEDVHADLDEVVDQVEHIAIGVKEDLGVGALL